MSNEETYIGFATFPTVECARAVANALVSEKLAACMNIVPGLESIYRWQGKVESGAEVLGILKFPARNYESLEQRFRDLHPYEVPELICWPIGRGLPAYLNWVAESA